jgi:hypothetical protein
MKKFLALLMVLLVFISAIPAQAAEPLTPSQRMTYTRIFRQLHELALYVEYRLTRPDWYEQSVALRMAAEAERILNILAGETHMYHVEATSILEQLTSAIYARPQDQFMLQVPIVRARIVERLMIGVHSTIPWGPVNISGMSQGDLNFHWRAIFGEERQPTVNQLYDALIEHLRPVNYRAWNSIVWRGGNNATWRRQTVMATQLQEVFEQLLEEVFKYGKTNSLKLFMEYYHTFVNVTALDSSIYQNSKEHFTRMYTPVLTMVNTLEKIAKGEVNPSLHLKEISEAWSALCAMAQYYEGYVLWDLRQP